MSTVNTEPSPTDSTPQKKKKSVVSKVVSIVTTWILVFTLILGAGMLGQSMGVLNIPLLEKLNTLVEDTIIEPFQKTPLAKSLGLDNGLTGEQKTGADGDTVYQDDAEHVGKTQLDDGTVVTYAPDPARPFRNAQCSTKPMKETVPENPNSWSIPAIGESASFFLSGHNGSLMTIPDAPQGTMYAADAQLGDDSGAILQAGHVDYAPGVLSPQGGELSPWGHLHQVNPCDHVYQKDAEGVTREFVVTDLYTVPQKEFGASDEYFRKDGPLNLYMVTCSGPSVGEDGAAAGNRLLFNYKYNLVVKAKPVA